MLIYIISLFLENKNTVDQSNKVNLVNLVNSNIINKLGKNKVNIDKINDKQNILELCPMSSYKQCSNNYNSYNKIDMITQFNKPKKNNRVNMWNGISL